MSIELKSDLTLLDPIRPFELSATSFDYTQTSRNPVTQMLLPNLDYRSSKYDSHRKVSNSHFLGCEESE